MPIFKISIEYEDYSMSSKDLNSLAYDPFMMFTNHAEKDEHFLNCARFDYLSNEEMAELEQWRLEMLLALEYSRNPPKDPEDY